MYFSYFSLYRIFHFFICFSSDFEFLFSCITFIRFVLISLFSLFFTLFVFQHLWFAFLFLLFFYFFLLKRQHNKQILFCFCNFFALRFMYTYFFLWVIHCSNKNEISRRNDFRTITHCLFGCCFFISYFLLLQNSTKKETIFCLFCSQKENSFSLFIHVFVTARLFHLNIQRYILPIFFVLFLILFTYFIRCKIFFIQKMISCEKHENCPLLKKLYSAQNALEKKTKIVQRQTNNKNIFFSFL